jgi:hypothetical protein
MLTGMLLMATLAACPGQTDPVELGGVEAQQAESFAVIEGTNETADEISSRVRPYSELRRSLAASLSGIDGQGELAGKLRAAELLNSHKNGWRLSLRPATLGPRSPFDRMDPFGSPFDSMVGRGPDPFGQGF